MKPAGCVVGTGAELAASVQFCEDHFYTGQAGPWLNVHWNAAAAVVH